MRDLVCVYHLDNTACYGGGPVRGRVGQWAVSVLVWRDPADDLPLHLSTERVPTGGLLL